jgi:aminopeptidase-like protein
MTTAATAATAGDPEGIVALTAELCAHHTGVVGPGDAAMFARLARELPLTVHRFASGETHNGWRVPERCDVEEAVVEGPDGRVVLRGGEHPLVVAAGSRGFEGVLDLQELRRHLVTDPARPTAYVFHCAWQYRPWEADWALSMPHERYARLTPGAYRVRLRVRRSPGEMLVGVAEHRGDDPRAWVFNSHTCHPGQANDGMVGVATLARLHRHLAGRRTRWSYRFVVGPEHLGTVFLLRDTPRAELERTLGAVFVEMTGVRSPMVATSTFDGGHPLDRAFAHLMRHRGGVTVGWREGAGNDETVWEAPGYEVPAVELTRRVDTFAPHPEYHSSLDTAGSLDPRAVDEAFRTLVDLVDILERDCTAHRRFDGLPCLSNPEYDLYPRRPDPAAGDAVDDEGLRWGRLVDRILRRFDGTTTCLAMADEAGLPFRAVRDHLGRFEERGLVRLRPAPHRRPPISTRED